MILAVDAGNSSVSFGLFDDKKVVAVFRAESRRGATADEYRDFLDSRMVRAGVMSTDVKGSVVACVVPQLVHVFFEALKGFGGAPLLVSPRLKLPITIKYSTPELLGADRIASASEAFTVHGGPVVVIDFGTATTFSLVDGTGAFIGGAIAPGMLTGYHALTERASGLPRAGLTFPKKAIGRDTGEGIQSGVIFGHAAMAEGLVERFRAELGADLKVVVTGGMAETVSPHMKGVEASDQLLSLKGLASIFRLN
ncbi:MAG: type III pantothenate kinase [Nitrospirae bacterium]|nr:type III pantothenate kinase [Nitrospirota bacterium]